MPRALKVFRTPIGFHDAYVAAPTKKAALEAWGTTHDLFARGSAEIVTDPTLTAEPLAAPGTVIKRSRGTTAEQIAALPAVERPTPKAEPSAQSEPGTRPASARAKANPEAKPKPKPKPVQPRPSADALDAAEAAVADAEKRHAEENRALDREQAALDRRRREQAREQAAERKTLRDTADRANATYASALKRWRAARTDGED